jgi:cytoplasmic iron level regulating protein YaaA (DUF328/UPF0246 family)
LLSPAKSIDCNIEIPDFDFTYPTFHKEATDLAKKLSKKSTQQLAELFHVSENIASLNFERFQNFELLEKPSSQNLPAGYIFTGEVYKGLNMHCLDDKYWSEAQDKIRILSGLYGLLKPFDLIYPYRLEMGTKWAVNSKTKNLYEFWGEKVLKHLEKEMSKDEIIVNLASNEYFKVLPKKSIKRKVITPVFKEFKNGSYKIIMMYAKHARGAMARYIIENQVQNLQHLKAYDEDGYRFQESLSTDEEWVFTR